MHVRLHFAVWFSAVLATALGCDGQVTVEGHVTDGEGSPIYACDVALFDVNGYDKFAAYVDGRSDVLPRNGRTDLAGFFSVTEIVGAGERDIWLVVARDGYLDHKERVWRGDGPHSADLTINLALVRAP